MNVLSDYGAGLSDDLILGHIAWWTVTKPRVTHTELLEAVTDLDLDPAIVPKPPRLGDAFKRACRYSERSGVPMPHLLNHTGNFLVRKVSQDVDEIERHLILEIVDPNGRKLEYIDAAHLILNRNTGELKTNVKKVHDDLKPLVMGVLEDLWNEFQDATKYIEAQVIRRMIRDQVDLIAGIPVRREGSVYFVPRSGSAKLSRLEELVDTVLNNGSAMHALPLVDTDKQREMVKGAFESEVHDESVQMIAELQRIKDSKKPITPRAWAAFKERFGWLKQRADEYGELVDIEMQKAELEMAALDEHLADFITSGLIKS